MHIHRRHLTQHRFQRLVLWTLALLMWIAAIGARAVSARHARQRFDIRLTWLAGLVSKLLIVRAAQLARLPARRRICYWRYGRDMRRRHMTRSILGARLRRALRHEYAAAWITGLINVVRNLDAYAAPLAQRMRRGFKRLWPITPAPGSAPPAFAMRASAPALADSS